MQVYGVDLAAWWRDRRWVALIELIDGLPSASRLNEAMANDDELAELMADQPEPTEPWAPRVSEYDLSTLILIQIADGIKALQQTQVAAAGGKPSKVKPFPTPRTAITRLREREDLDLFYDMQEKFGFGPKPVDN